MIRKYDVFFVVVYQLYHLTNSYHALTIVYKSRATKDIDFQHYRPSPRRGFGHSEWTTRNIYLIRMQTTFVTLRSRIKTVFYHCIDTSIIDGENKDKSLFWPTIRNGKNGKKRRIVVA